MNSYLQQIQNDTGKLLVTHTSRSHSPVHTLARNNQTHCTGKKQEVEVFVNLFGYFENHEYF